MYHEKKKKIPITTSQNEPNKGRGTRTKGRHHLNLHNSQYSRYLILDLGIKAEKTKLI